jgi:hypothetical protein
MFILGRGVFPIKPVEDKTAVSFLDTLHKEFCCLLTDGTGVQGPENIIFSCKVYTITCYQRATKCKVEHAL